MSKTGSDQMCDLSAAVRSAQVGPVSQAAYLLGIASEHRVDQLDPMGQAGGDHIAWPVGRANLLSRWPALRFTV